MIMTDRDGTAGGRRSVRNEDGTLSAVDGMVLVRSAFQPVFRCQGERIVPVAFEALARPFRGDVPLLPESYFGQIAPGAAGDVVVWSGDPLEPLSQPSAVFVNGVEQPLTSRPLMLRDRYRQQTPMPPAYRN